MCEEIVQAVFFVCLLLVRWLVVEKLLFSCIEFFMLHRIAITFGLYCFCRINHVGYFQKFSCWRNPFPRISKSVYQDIPSWKLVKLLFKSLGLSSTWGVWTISGKAQCYLVSFDFTSIDLFICCCWWLEKNEIKMEFFEQTISIGIYISSILLSPSKTCKFLWLLTSKPCVHRTKISRTKVTKNHETLFVMRF